MSNKDGRLGSIEWNVRPSKVESRGGLRVVRVIRLDDVYYLRSFLPPIRVHLVGVSTKVDCRLTLISQSVQLIFISL